MYAGLPFTVTVTVSNTVGIWPEAKDGAVLQVSPPWPRLAGARSMP